MIPNLLFYQKGNLHEFLTKRKLELEKEVENYDCNYILNVSEEDFYKYLISKYSLVPPVIHEDKIYVHNKEIDINISTTSKIIVKGVQVTIVIPFEGDSVLFQYSPSTSTFNPPHGEITDQKIHLIYKIIGHNAEELQQEYKHELIGIKEYIDWVKQDIINFNKSLNPFVKQFVSQRKKKLLDDIKLVSSLGIPVKRRTDLPETYTIPSIRKESMFNLPKVSKDPFNPEPTLLMKEYENILETILNMSLFMERSPKTFYRLKEEEIRNFFLLMLNAIYEGQATGETFNFGGKTDILIRIDGKNVFIAECKFWRGEISFIRTIEQLFGYLSWRDTRTIILFFNKNKDLTSLLKKIDPVVKKHTCFKREHLLKSDKLQDKTIFSYVLHQPRDKNRELILTIMVFDVPKEKI
jgi:hypothetical protein